jgi:Sap, sulfolipid-1-addressing protein
MSSLVPKLILTGLGASVSPVAVTLLITVMFRPHPRRNSLLFLLGFTLTLLAIGITFATVFNRAGSGGTSHADGYVDLALGLLCLALIPLSLRRKGGQAADNVEKDLKASRAFYRGIIAMLINTSTMVLYIAGVHEISAAKLSTAGNVLAFAVLTLVTLVTLIIPIGIYFVFPRKSEQVLDKLSTWLFKHMKEIGVAVLLVFGVYLLIKGIIALA